MPVEIYQLNINVNVKDDKGGAKEGGNNGKGSTNKREIIEECVEAVLEIIQQKDMR